MKDISSLRLILPFLLALVLAVPGTAPAQETEAGFLPGLEDVPVLEGLIVDENGAVVFDSPSGRIVEIFAAGPVDRGSVLEFYGATLPEMGWQALAGDKFQREKEQLTIDFFGSGGNLSVRFTLAPL